MMRRRPARWHGQTPVSGGLLERLDGPVDDAPELPEWLRRARAGKNAKDLTSYVVQAVNGSRK